MKIKIDKIAIAVAAIVIIALNAYFVLHDNLNNTTVLNTCEFYESGKPEGADYAVFAKCKDGGAILYRGNVKHKG